MTALLAFDTAGPFCAAALLVNETVTHRVDEMARGQAEHLMPMLEEMLDQASLGWRNLDALAVCVGPGNFTGIRISVAAARGLAMGLDKPAIGISRFATTRALSGQALVASPAPRDQVYVMDFDRAEAPWLSEKLPEGAVLSSAYSARDHITCLARLASDRLAKGGTMAPPAPLYVKPADAAPSREAPPVMLD